MTAQATRPILEFDDVDLPAASRGTLLEGLDLGVSPGQLVLVKITQSPVALPVAEAAVGLVQPTRGQVRFQGLDWRERTPLEAAASRHAIGRVYGDTEWISNLDVDENVILGCCHHTRRPEAEIVEEALALARRFGLVELTARRPDRVDHGELRAYALVRAFLGEPSLILLERPLRGVRYALRQPLLDEIARARAGGAGVLWMTPDDGVFESDETGADLRYVLDGRRLRALGGDRS